MTFLLLTVGKNFLDESFSLFNFEQFSYKGIFRGVNGFQVKSKRLKILMKIEKMNLYNFSIKYNLML